ncbi:hypothetical protein C4K08_1355 [Pseudomonas chlororaphis subsp. aureofaciens]|nr:hypothetical protein C4K08_1355 [Pseudomonas chlororaphis subsp. aureofaciens]
MPLQINADRKVGRASAVQPRMAPKGSKTVMEVKFHTSV